MLFVFLYFIADILSANYNEPVNEEDYKALKYLAEGRFTKSRKEHTRKEKSAVIRFWNPKGKLKIIQSKLL